MTEEVPLHLPDAPDHNLNDGLPEPGSLPESRPQDTVVSFTTSRGSVYTYDADGRTTRLKTKTGVEQPTQDITVFVEVGMRDAKTIAAAYLLRSATEKTRVEVVEQQPDGLVRVVSDIREVTNPEALQVVTFRGDTVVKSKPASLFPKLGLFAFDSRRFDENGVTRTERHLGHKVSSIKYKV